MSVTSFSGMRSSFQRRLLGPAVLGVDPGMHALHLNRAQVYIKLEWFSAALADALHVAGAPQCPPAIKDKALYRSAAAEYSLGRYTETLDRLNSLGDDPSDFSLRSRSKQRLDEMTDGKYAWTEMFRAGQAPVPHLDVADLVSPAIKVSTVPNRGRGRCIRATQKMHAGDLLVSVINPTICFVLQLIVMD